MNTKYVNPSMFVLKKYTDFKIYRRIYSTEKFVYAISSSSVDVMSRDLRHDSTLYLQENVIDIYKSDILYLLTRSNAYIVRDANIKKICVDDVYYKILQYKDKMLLCSRKKVSIYSLDMKYKCSTSIKNDDIITSELYIHVTHGGVIHKYVLINHLLVKKQMEEATISINLHNGQSNKLYVYNDNIYSIKGAAYLFVYQSDMFIACTNGKKYLVRDNSIVCADTYIEDVSADGQYVLACNEVKRLTKNVRLQVRTRSDEKEANKQHHMTAKYDKATNGIIVCNYNKQYKVVRKRNLENIKNIRFKNKINTKEINHKKEVIGTNDKSDEIDTKDKNDLLCANELHHTNSKEDTTPAYFEKNNINYKNNANISVNEITPCRGIVCQSTACSNDLFTCGDIFIHCKNLQNYYIHDNILVLISTTQIIRYKLWFTEDKDNGKYKCISKIHFVHRLDIKNVILVTNNYIYYRCKTEYNIVDINTGDVYNYIQKDVTLIRNVNNHLLIYDDFTVRIYKINTHKYQKVQIHVNNGEKSTNIESDRSVIDQSDATITCQEHNKETRDCTIKTRDISPNHTAMAQRNNQAMVMHVNTGKHSCNTLDSINPENGNIFPQANDVLQAQEVCEYVYKNIRFKGMHVYKNDNLVKQDYIYRNIRSFLVYKNIIYINDEQKYIVLLSTEFDLLGMVYINEYVTDWFIESAVHFVSEIGNIYSIREEHNTNKNSDEYYKHKARVNFVIKLQ